jgi:hypothetical protein
MVYQHINTPEEGQIARHAGSHLPDGMDPVFTTGGEAPANGDGIFYINGTWVVSNIQTVINNYTSGANGVFYIPFGSSPLIGQAFTH